MFSGRMIWMSMLMVLVSAAALLAADTVTPANDPPVARPTPLVEGLRDVHPRLLLTREDLPKLRVTSEKTPAGRSFFSAMSRYASSAQVPRDGKWISDATEAQKVGFWQAPAIGLHYLMKGDKASLEKGKAFLKVFVEAEHWETGAEQDSGMGAANIMIGAGLLYDWLYHELEPEFRQQARKKLLLQARRMYYRGHMKLVPGTHYWQGDPHNNHRWHRDAGLAACVLAVAESKSTDDLWIRSKLLEELSFIHKWLPHDGTSHESRSFWAFGMPHLSVAMDMASRCFGVKLLDHDYFKNAAMFRMQTMTPGLEDVFCYGDGGGTHFFNHFTLMATAHHKQADLQTAILKLVEVNPRAFGYGWWGVVWYDAAIPQGNPANLPLNYYFSDLGLGFARDGWDSKGVGVMFKCAPYGGWLLNRYRNENGFQYVNVAHDDPDANSFEIYARGSRLAMNDPYATKKLSSSQNTILVDGKGQIGEGEHWTQPGRGGVRDMTQTAWVTTWKDAGEIMVMEGEAGGSYPDLVRYRRTMIFVRGKYVLLLDDIRAKKPVELTWLVQGKEAAIIDEKSNRFGLADGATRMDFQMVSSSPVVAKVVTSTAEDKGKSMGWKQVQIATRGQAWATATVFDAWGRGKLEVTMGASAGRAVITVSGPGFSDTWTWAQATNAARPAGLEAKLHGGKTLTVGQADMAEIPYPGRGK